MLPLWYTDGDKNKSNFTGWEVWRKGWPDFLYKGREVSLICNRGWWRERWCSETGREGIKTIQRWSKLQNMIWWSTWSFNSLRWKRVESHKPCGGQDRGEGGGGEDRQAGERNLRTVKLNHFSKHATYLKKKKSSCFREEDSYEYSSMTENYR